MDLGLKTNATVKSVGWIMKPINSSYFFTTNVCFVNSSQQRKVALKHANKICTQYACSALLFRLSTAGA